jgi:hypothetical protein
MTLDQARQKLPLDSLMAAMGHGDAAKSKAKSPFRDDKNPSFGIYRATDGRLRWKDHATGEGGDEVDYLALAMDLSPQEAQRKYIEMAGGANRVDTSTGKYRVKRKGQPDEPKPPIFCWSQYRERANDTFLAGIVEERKVSAEILLWAKANNILGATDEGQPAFCVNGGSAAHYRVSDGSWRYEPRGAKVAPLVFGNPQAPEAWVFESQWDALAIADRASTLDSILFVVTRGANNGQLAKEVCEGKKVVAWPQNDSAKNGGKVPSDEWLKEVRACTHECKVARIPAQFKDPNDWTESGATKEDIAQMVANATLPELAGIEIFSPKKLMAFKPTEDATTLLGDRWICRGGSALLVGPAGIGKSSLAAQMAVFWALGLPAFGIKPVRPLKSVFIQAENDEGDMAEMVQGVYFHALKEAMKAGMDTEKVADLLAKNLLFARDTVHVGDSFVAVVDALAGLHKPDLIWCDPLLSYVGDNISSQKVASTFLRGKLNPVSFRHGFAWMMVHHTGKPPGDAKTRQKWTETDFAYIGLGSSELTNWARACLYLEVLGDGVFALRLTKRGKRAGVATESGFSVTRVGLQHGEKNICWEPCELPSDGERAGTLTEIQMDEVVLHRKNGKSLSEIIKEMGLKNTKGSMMGKGQLCKILAAFEQKNGSKNNAN